MFIIVYNGVGVWQVLLELPIRIIAITLFRGKWFSGRSKSNHCGVPRWVKKKKRQLNNCSLYKNEFDVFLYSRLAVKLIYIYIPPIRRDRNIVIKYSQLWYYFSQQFFFLPLPYARVNNTHKNIVDDICTEHKSRTLDNNIGKNNWTETGEKLYVKKKKIAFNNTR